MGRQVEVGVLEAEGGAGRPPCRGEAPGRGVHEGAEGTGDQGAQAVLGTPPGGDDQRGEYSTDKCTGDSVLFLLFYHHH